MEWALLLTQFVEFFDAIVVISYPYDAILDMVFPLGVANYSRMF